MSRHRHSRVPATMDEAREYCLELERKREWKRRQSRQGKFEAGIESIDNLIDQFDDPSKITALSDHGTAAERIVACASECIVACDDDVGNGKTPRNKRDYAALKLRRAGLGELVEVFLLICKNGNNREESIWQLMKKIRKRGDKQKRNIAIT